jgi:hypothetical protein
MRDDDLRFLARARALSPDASVAACWSIIVKVIEEELLDRGDVREVVWNLREGLGYDVQQLAVQRLEGQVHMTFEDDRATCELDSLVAALKALIREPATVDAAGLAPDVLRRKLELHDEWVVTIDKQGERAQLVNADLRQIDLAGLLLPDAVLYRANFDGVTLVDQDLHSATVVGATFRGADLTKAALTEGDADDVDFEDARMVATHLGRTSLQRANLRRADLRDAHLRSADLQAARLDGADLRGADLQDTIFDRTNLDGADLRGAKSVDRSRVYSVIVGGQRLEVEDAREWLRQAAGEVR